MKKILLLTIGLLMLTLSACGASAEATPVEPASAPEVSAPATEAPAVEPVAESTEPAAAASSVSFSADVLPILNNSCNGCHGIDQVKAGLDMTSYESLMAGSFDGAVLVEGNAAESMLVELVTSGKMPKRGDKLTTGQIQIITDWINAGAPNN